MELITNILLIIVVTVYGAIVNNYVVDNSCYSVWGH